MDCEGRRMREPRVADLRLANVLRTTVVLILVAGLAACAPGSDRGSSSPLASASPSPTLGTVSGKVTAGPICPVEREPPDPSCAPRPVAGAVLIVQTTGGREVTRTTSAADGTFHVFLAPGAYRLAPQPVAGYMGTAQLVEFQVVAGQRTPELEVSYDTGIR
jgi:hypothetical protein